VNGDAMAQKWRIAIYYSGNILEIPKLLNNINSKIKCNNIYNPGPIILYAELK